MEGLHLFGMNISLKEVLRTVWYSSEFLIIIRAKWEMRLEKIQKYHWKAYKIPHHLVKSLHSGGHLAASEARK